MKAWTKNDRRSCARASWDRDWRTSCSRQFLFRRWGFSLRMQFPIVKLLDYRKDIIELGLELKFGADGLALMPLVRQVKKLDLLRSIRQTLRTAETLQPIRALLSQTE